MSAMGDNDQGPLLTDGVENLATVKYAYCMFMAR
jgi:hypothetical protein